MESCNTTNTERRTLGSIIVRIVATELVAGMQYRFPTGKWKLVGDPTVYSGGMVFYVPKNGMYIIEEGE